MPGDNSKYEDVQCSKGSQDLCIGSRVLLAFFSVCLFVFFTEPLCNYSHLFLCKLQNNKICLLLLILPQIELRHTVSE